MKKSMYIENISSSGYGFQNIHARRNFFLLMSLINLMMTMMMMMMSSGSDRWVGLPTNQPPIHLQEKQVVKNTIFE